MGEALLTAPPLRALTAGLGGVGEWGVDPTPPPRRFAGKLLTQRKFHGGNGNGVKGSGPALVEGPPAPPDNDGEPLPDLRRQRASGAGTPRAPFPTKAHHQPARKGNGRDVCNTRGSCGMWMVTFTHSRWHGNSAVGHIRLAVQEVSTTRGGGGGGNLALRLRHAMHEAPVDLRRERKHVAVVLRERERPPRRLVQEREVPALAPRHGLVPTGTLDLPPGRPKGGKNLVPAHSMNTHAKKCKIAEEMAVPW